MENSKQMLSQVVSIPLEDHDLPQDIAHFDLMNCILSLLQDPDRMVTENLVINPDDPLSMYWPPNNKLGEAHSG